MVKKVPGLLFLILAFGSVLIVSCSTHDGGECQQFRNGTFSCRYRGEKGDVVFHIHRQDSLQIETVLETGYTSKLRVRWTDKCKYETLVLETTHPFPDTIQHIRKTVPLKTEIIAWTKDYYVFGSYRDGYAMSLVSDTMWIEK